MCSVELCICALIHAWAMEQIESGGFWVDGKIVIQIKRAEKVKIFWAYLIVEKGKVRRKEKKKGRTNDKGAGKAWKIKKTNRAEKKNINETAWTIKERENPGRSHR